MTVRVSERTLKSVEILLLSVKSVDIVNLFDYLCI